MKKSLGICIGASSIKIVSIDENYKIQDKIIKNHECNPRKALKETLKDINLDDYSYVSLTGRKFKELLNLPQITEPEATEYALHNFLKNNKTKFNALISLGSENFILYVLNEQGNIINVQTGNKCASGTGEFFLQQTRRMNVDVKEAIGLAKDSDPYFVSGRCSVFCKSDCTHALNKGIPIGNVSAGLGNMIGEKILELLRSLDKENMIVVGGVTKNSYVIDMLNKHVKNLVVPDTADIFEAYGAAVYALENKKTTDEKFDVKDEDSSFSCLPSLEQAQHLVEFKEHGKAKAKDGDECILGLDVGSTTTKAVLMRSKDDKVLADIYLRTNGNPIKASVECYKEINKQLGKTKVKITGLGVTGSGRQIAGLHALTDGIINEIIAHATGATFFDKDVDTIMEIGGQDAKYTYLVNGVPCDYAMNEACSAGTGSFLEEAAKESLNISYLDIQDIALKGKNPPNFNDQCAAFISSDIKNASHENITKNDIVAGLVYSICMNYNNRVKGSRKVGDRIFMQGGVCYNRAVPLAMASILQKPIVVPADPGLIGAFGVALEVKSRIENGLMKKSDFSLKELIKRKVEYGKSFVCPGTQENCDRGCNINIIKLNDKSYPFGGICNKYYNIMHNLSIDPKALDFVEERQNLVFPETKEIEGKSIGISRSFYTNILYPLYYTFFTDLGFKIVLSDNIDSDGTKMTNSSFCYPAEIAHGMFMNLIKKNTDYLFLPHVSQLHVENSILNGKEHHATCVLAQSEPYYIKSAFRDIKAELITPILNFSKGWNTVQDEFIKIGKQLGQNEEDSIKAYQKGVEKLNYFNTRKKEYGDKVLKELEKDKSKIAVVLFGRSYNAFADEANMGIPRKFASRGIYIIPFDCLRYKDEDSMENMTWATGQEIMKATRFVKKHPQLYGAYITNFSCGPDSFLIGYFRDIMKTKPSLTLELDSHSADAGINTRIEAFLDIVQRFRKLGLKDKKETKFTPAEVIEKNGKFYYNSSEGEIFPLKHSKIKLMVPSMGRTTAELAAAAFRGLGFNAEAVKKPDFKTLMLGRGNTSCKECLPLILTTASLLDYIDNRYDKDELLLYFMPTVAGNCRFSQYYVFQKELVKKKKLKNVAFLTLTADNSYAGLGAVEQMRILRSLVVADVMDDIKNAMLVLPKDKEKAMQIFNEQWDKVTAGFSNGDNVYKLLRKVAEEFKKIELRYPIEEAKKVLLAGEIYVRKDEFSSQGVIERLAKKDIVVKRSPVLEWMYYVDHIVKHQLKPDLTFKNTTELFFKTLLQNKMERKIKKILASGLYEYEIIDIDEIMKIGSKFIDPALTGESIVITGAFFHEVANLVHGAISIGPFACLPTRLTESILSQESKVAGNKRLSDLENIDELQKYHTLPFLSIEADGNPFPQIVEARIEAFSLQVERLHKLAHT